MNKIRMLRSEPVQTRLGAFWFRKDQVYENVDPAIVDSLVGRGLALLLPGDTEMPSPDVLSQKTVVELRKLAQLAGIPRYNFLSKNELVDALTPSP